MSERIGPVMIDVQGLELDDVERRRLQHPMVGGVILFSRNFESPAQLTALVQSIRSCRNPLLIAVDQEGGRVQRFKTGFTRLAPLGELGAHYNADPDNARQQATQHATTMAHELKAYDIDFSFTPVLDRDCNLNAVIGDRSFHQDPDVITDLASQYIDAMHREHMPATGKHFPGHGGVTLDSHEALPFDERSLDDLASSDMRPFAALADKLDAIMPAHIVFPAVDDLPVGFSKRWLTQILRDSLGFQGVIFSDDLTMKATESFGDYPQRAQKALAAGCDMVLVCNNPQGADQVLEALTSSTLVLDASRQRLERLLLTAAHV